MVQDRSCLDRNTQELIALSVARLNLLPVAAQMKVIFVFSKQQAGHWITSSWPPPPSPNTHLKPLVVCVHRPLLLMAQQQKNNNLWHQRLRPVRRRLRSTSSSRCCAARLNTSGDSRPACIRLSYSPLFAHISPPTHLPTPPHPQALPMQPNHTKTSPSFSRLRRPHWWLPGIHSFSGTWTKSCAADLEISEVGRPRPAAEETEGPDACAPGWGPCIHLGPHPALLLLPLRLHLLCSPSLACVECVHWGGQRGNNKHKGPVYSL